MRTSIVATNLLTALILADGHWAFGQKVQEAVGEVAMSYPIINATQLSPIRVKDIDTAAGRAILTFDPKLAVLVIIPRGETLLLAQDPESKKITQALRANVTEMLEKGEAVVTLGPEAAKAIRPGPVLLVYPFEGLAEIGTKAVYPVSSNKFRKLPEVIGMLPKAGSEGADKIEALREAEAFAQSTNNLKQIMLALHNFHSVYNHFPPAVIYGPDGKPWHSWRTLLLPFLEQASLYQKYDFSKPWDSPKNRAVVETVVPVFQDPVYGKAAGPVTHYAALVGAKAIFRPDGARIRDTANPLADMAAGSRSIREIIDGTSNTLMIVPVADDRKIPWAKPEDLTVGPDFPPPGMPGGIAMPYRATEGKGRRGPVSRADGSVFPLSDDTPMSVVGAMITPAGGEFVDQGRFERTTRRAPQRIPTFRILVRPDGSYAGSFD